MGWRDGKPVDTENVAQPAWMRGKPIDFQGLQQEARNSEQIRRKIENDPISRGAREASQETTVGDLLGSQRLGRAIGGNPAATTAQRIASSLPVSFATGAASTLLGPAQMVQNYIADTSNGVLSQLGVDKRIPRSPLNDSLQTYEQMRNAGGVAGSDIANFAGNVMSPVGIGLAKAVEPAASLLGRVGQGALIGGGLGVTSQNTNGGDNYWSEQVNKGLGGAAIGGTVPLAVDLALGIGNAVRHGYRGTIEPFFQKGRDMAEGRDYVSVAGDRADEIAGALRSPNSNVPGYKPTAAEVVATLPQSLTKTGQSEFAGLQANVTPNAPSAGKAVEQQQGRALVDNIRSFGKSPSDIAAAEAERESTSGLIYKNAFAADKQRLDNIANEISAGNVLKGATGYDAPNKVTSNLEALKNNPIISAAAKEAKILAASMGENIKDPMESLQGLHYMKLAIDNQFKNRTASTALQDYSDAALSNTKQQLLKAIEGSTNSPGISPLYGIARKNYAEMSTPINQMRIGQELEGRLTSALQGDTALRPGVFAGALRDSANIPQKAGAPRFQTLEEALLPQNMVKVNDVANTLSNKALADQLGRAGSTQAAKITGTPDVVMPRTLNLPLNIARFVIRMAQGQGTSRMDQEMARDMLTNPERVSELMVNALKRANTMNEAVKAIRQYSPLATQGAVNQQRQK